MHAAAFPPFPEAARAQSTLLEEVQLAVLGRKPVNEAVASSSSACELPPSLTSTKRAGLRPVARSPGGRDTFIMNVRNRRVPI